MPRRRARASLIEDVKFLPGELVRFTDYHDYWTDAITEDGTGYREDELKIMSGTPAIVLRYRIVNDDDETIGSGFSHDIDNCPEGSFPVYDVLVNGSISTGWQSSALEKI